MNPNDVPAVLVEKAARAIHEARCCPLDEASDCYGEPLYVEEDQARHALAAVIPDIQAQAWDEGQAAGLREGNLMRAYGEAKPGLNPYRAARRTEEPTDG